MESYVANVSDRCETLACAISMGVVGIWCMHFIGNRAIVLGNGEPPIQIVYSSGYTTLSVVLPVTGLIIAFSTGEYRPRRPCFQWVAISSAGVFAGCSIVGMHYLGNLGVTNYLLRYSSRFLTASIIIAIGDCLAVLVLFYRLREQWISAWWKRVFCAMALAGGISAMHFTASTSCSYTLRRYNTQAQMRSRNVQVLIAGVLCGTAALFVLSYLLIAQHRQRLTKRRSQKVMLASAVFDPSGRILVTTEGLLPCKEITDKYNQRTFDDDFDTAHPVFQWIFRVTHNWSGVSDLIPRMKSHIGAARENGLDSSRPGSSQSSAMYDAETYNNYEILFEERFCTAAASIASSLHIPIGCLGTLYDKIVETGTLMERGSTSQRLALVRDKTTIDLEALRLNMFGKGQLLFITREVTEEESWRLLNAGYRFGNVQHVARPIAHALQIPLYHLELHLAGLKRYCQDLRAFSKPGTWISFFAMVPKPHHKGFDVVVKRNHQDQLPDVQLLQTRPEPWQHELLARLDGQRVQHILSLAKNPRDSFTESLDIRDLRFILLLRDTIKTLIHPFPQEWIRTAQFWAKPISAQYAHPMENQATSTTMYAFTVIGDMHGSIDGAETLTRIPRTFFEARHRCYPGSPDHALLAREIRSTFEPLFAQRQEVRARRLGKLSSAMTGRGNPIAKLKAVHAGLQVSSRSSSINPSEGSSSIHELVDKPLRPSDSSYGSEKFKTQKWGGIMVNSETVVTSDSENGISNNERSTKGLPLGTNVAVSTAKPEVTFVDQLVAITKERFLPNSRAGTSSWD